MKTVAIVPAYNEAKTVIDVLNRLQNFVDDILVINDGSKDETERLILKWLAAGGQGELVSFAQNQGYATAILTGYALIEERLLNGRLEQTDIVLTIDADGQHHPEDIPRLIAFMLENNLDGVRGRRRLDEYPKLKQIGNKLISWTLSPLAGTRIYDALDGFLLQRVSTLEAVLDYVTGIRYTTAPEIAVILPRLGYRISDGLYIDSPCPKSNTKFRDAFLDVVLGVVALFRVVFRVKTRRRPLPVFGRRVADKRGKAA